MALDKNLFTLNFEESKIEAKAIDLVDPAGTIHYRKQVVSTEAGTYLISLSDPLSGSILATAAAPSATSKEKVIELYNPSATVPLTYKGTLTFKWLFTWEGHDFEWKREACHMIRKPDPPVIVAITKEPTGKIKTTMVQILDYNLNRFEIDDKKGFEVVLLTSLLTFADYSEQLRAKPTPEIQNIPPATSTPASITPEPPSRPPAKPEGWKEDQIAILQAREQRTVNEVVIGEVGEIYEYVNHCVSLLEDETLLFITLRSLTPSCVSKVVQVAEMTKRIRYKKGYDDEHDLHQYVDMSFDEALTADGKKKGKAPRVINLDDRPAPSSSNTASYQPPNSLIIHLSKISMPELEPKKKTKKHDSKPAHSSSHSQYASEPNHVSRSSVQDPPTDKRERRKSVATKPAKDKSSSSSGGGLLPKFNSATTQSTPPSLPPSQSSRPQSGHSRSHQSSSSSRPSPQHIPPLQQPQVARPDAHLQQTRSPIQQQPYPSQQHNYPAGYATPFPPGFIQQPPPPPPTSGGFFGKKRR